MKKKVITILFYISIVLYIIWEVYWYNRVGLLFIKWHTHLAIPFILFLLFYHVFRAFKLSNRWMNNLFIFFISVFLFELMVQVTGVGKTVMEKEYGVYVSWKERRNHAFQDYYWINSPHSIKKLYRKNIFYYERKTNSLGYSDVEWEIEKDTNEVRVLCLGDSFTEGDGAPHDSTYVALLEKMFKKESIVKFMNAGKCGSDPFFNYINYKDRLHVFNPDVILQTISTQDLIQDIPQRGGLERFEENYGLKFQEVNPLVELIHAVSYTSRPLFYLIGYDKKLIRTKKRERTSVILNNIDSLFVKYAFLSGRNSSQLKVIVFPLEKEVFNGYERITQEAISQLQKYCEVIDLRPYIKQKIGSEDRIYDYYWKGDGHFNSRGYQLMGEAIYDAILSEKKHNAN